MQPPEWISGGIPELPAGLDWPYMQQDFEENREARRKMKKKRIYRVKE